MLRNEEYAILKWFASVEAVSGAPGLDLPALDCASVADAYGVKAHRAGGLEELRERLAAAIAADAAGAGRGPGLSGDGAGLVVPAGATGIDRAPEELAAGTPQPLRADLGRLLGEDRVLPRALDLVRYASDASPYRLLPKAVVRPRHAGEVAAVLGYARREGIPVTLRAAGTSLNGQAQGDGILVDVRRHFSGVGVEEGGALARVRPGTVLAHANRVLARHGRKLGPDPASHEAATIGGVIANNSGGMRCGVVHDSYSTVRSLSFVLPSGTQIDSAATGAEERFAEAEPELARGLAEIRDEIRADAELSERIAAQVRDQEHHRLPALRLPRRGDAAGDIPPAAGRIGGDPGLRLRSGLRDDPAAPPDDHRLGPFRGDRAPQPNPSPSWSPPGRAPSS